MRLVLVLSALLVIFVLVFCSPMRAAEPDYFKAYQLAGEWLDNAKKDLEGHQWKVVSNQWSVKAPYRGTVILLSEDKNKKKTITMRYRLEEEIYKWLRPGDLITLTVRSSENNRMCLREEILSNESKIEPGNAFYYEYSYITGVILAPIN